MFMENGECSRRLADCNKLLCALPKYISKFFVVMLSSQRWEMAAATGNLWI